MIGQEHTVFFMCFAYGIYVSTHWFNIINIG